MKCEEKRDNRNNPYFCKLAWSKFDATVSRGENFKRYFAGRIHELFWIYKDRANCETFRAPSKQFMYKLKPTQKYLYINREIKGIENQSKKPSTQVMEIAERKWAKLLW